MLVGYQLLCRLRHRAIVPTNSAIPSMSFSSPITGAGVSSTEFPSPSLTSVVRDVREPRLLQLTWCSRTRRRDRSEGRFLRTTFMGVCLPVRPTWLFFTALRRRAVVLPAVCQMSSTPSRAAYKDVPFSIRGCARTTAWTPMVPQYAEPRDYMLSGVLAHGYLRRAQKAYIKRARGKDLSRRIRQAQHQANSRVFARWFRSAMEAENSTGPLLEVRHYEADSDTKLALRDAPPAMEPCMDIGAPSGSSAHLADPQTRRRHGLRSPGDRQAVPSLRRKGRISAAHRNVTEPREPRCRHRTQTHHERGKPIWC